jgi:hypothetical protein
MSNDKLRELSEKATLGPWEANHYEFNYELWFLEHRNVPNYPNLKPTIAAMNGPCMAYANARNDAAFIVACVNHVREVLAQPVPAEGAQALRAKVGEWHKTSSDYENTHAQESTHYGSASHIAESYYRGAKEAFYRVLNEMNSPAPPATAAPAETKI